MRNRIACVLTALSVVLSGCYMGTENTDKKTMIIASDLHYLDRQLYDDGTAFTKVIENGDGKNMSEIENIVDAFFLDVIETEPDVLVLSGDLSFNGEKLSHEKLCEKLKNVKDAGITVLVIPGNHDIANANARGYEGDEQYFTSSTSSTVFASLYDAYGRNDALYRDECSYSYVYELDDTWFVMLDVNDCETINVISTDTLSWLEEVLVQARKQKKRVISVTHQNLLEQSMFKDGFMITNAEDVVDLYHQYNVTVNFSGHIHIQHYTEEDGLYEIITSALPVAKLHYGKVEWDDEMLSYQTESLSDQQLVSDSMQFFAESARTKAWNRCEDREMTDYYVSLNMAYFTGDLSGVTGKDSLISQWYETDAFTGMYVKSMADLAGQNYNALQIPFQSGGETQ